VTAGFQAFTDSGLLQIDGLTPNMTLRQKIGVTTAPGTLLICWTYNGDAGPLAPVATVNFSASTPLCAVYSPGCPATIVSTTNTGPGQWSALIWSSSPASLDFYVFDQVPAVSAPAGPGYGLQVFTPAGGCGLIYDARQPPVSVLGFQAGNIIGADPAGWYGGSNGWPGNTSQSFSYPVSKVASAAILNAGIAYRTQYYALSAWQHSGGTAIMDFINVNAGEQYPPNNFVGFGSVLSWSALIIDVSCI